MAAQPCPQLVSYEEFVPLAERSSVDLELHFGLNGATPYAAPGQGC